VSYDPSRIFTLIAQYSRYIGGLCVLNEFFRSRPLSDFIAYAKSKPGLSYGSSGLHQAAHGRGSSSPSARLNLKHVPYKGESPGQTPRSWAKHQDFVAVSGQHMQYVKRGSSHAS